MKTHPLENILQLASWPIFRVNNKLDILKKNDAADNFLMELYFDDKTEELTEVLDLTAEQLNLIKKLGIDDQVTIPCPINTEQSNKTIVDALFFRPFDEYMTVQILYQPVKYKTESLFSQAKSLSTIHQQLNHQTGTIKNSLLELSQGMEQHVNIENQWLHSQISEINETVEKALDQLQDLKIISKKIKLFDFSES